MLDAITLRLRLRLESRESGRMYAEKTEREL